MAGFFYFLPGCPLGNITNGRSVNHAVLDDVGVDAILSDCDAVPDDMIITDTAAGPGGNAGVCLYPKSAGGNDPASWGYSASRQTWHEVLGDKLWLGWENDGAPRPVDLVRKASLEDYVVRDDSGCEWSVPCARSTDSQRSSLPVEYIFTNGDIARMIAPAYESLWQLSGQVLDHFRGVTPRSEQWLVEAALAVLQVNYRIGKSHVTALQGMGRAVLTRKTVAAILLALVDNDLEQELVEQKKTSTTAVTPSQSVPG